jgi:hypothetical protein
MKLEVECEKERNFPFQPILLPFSCFYVTVWIIAWWWPAVNSVPFFSFLFSTFPTHSHKFTHHVLNFVSIRPQDGPSLLSQDGLVVVPRRGEPFLLRDALQLSFMTPSLDGVVWRK